MRYKIKSPVLAITVLIIIFSHFIHSDQSFAKISGTQTTTGNQSPAIIAGGNVAVSYGVSQEAFNALAETVKGNQKTIDRLLKNLDEKDIDIKKRDEEIQKWIGKYKELESQFA